LKSPAFYEPAMARAALSIRSSIVPFRFLCLCCLQAGWPINAIEQNAVGDTLDTQPQRLHGMEAEDRVKKCLIDSPELI
jgi:hypothetical protein